MSFAVLGCVIPNIVLMDKDCVDKTYPEFWIDLDKKFGLTVETVTLPPPKAETPPSEKGKFY